MSTTTLTYLFTDIEGSTWQWETTPDMGIRVEQHYAVLRDCVVAAGGEVFAMMGDGIAAAFASARAAVGAAIAAQLRLPASGLEVRMGLHTGEAERVGDDYRGRALNRAARIMATGHGGQILLSDVTATLVRTGPDPIGLIDLGVHEFRDLTEPEHIWQATHAALACEFPPLRGVANPAIAQTSRWRTSFVGRERELRDVVARLRHHPIVTLTGPGGVGKTRLAERVAWEAGETEPIWFADLSVVTDDSCVGEVVAGAAGLPGAAASFDRLAAAIGDRQALLVIDNCEHVLDTVAALVDRLAGACRRLRILATSREPLLIDGEYVVGVPALHPPTAAAELFEQRVAATGSALDASLRPAVERICERLGGLPLAIELAAARVPMFGLHGVEALLDRPFDVLVARSRTGDQRHRTMYAAIDWSYRLLDTGERRMLEWLAVFSGGFELDAAEFVAERCGLGAIAGAEALDSLVRKSMIDVVDGHPCVRYRLLESIRVFALERLAASHQSDAAHRALAEWMATITDLPFDEPAGDEVESAVLRLERESSNWAMAIASAVALRSQQLVERLCGPPALHFLMCRYELAGVLERALAVCQDGPARRAVACGLVCAAVGSPDPTDVQRWNEEVQRLDEPTPTATAHLSEWISLSMQGSTDDGVRWCIEGARDRRWSQPARDFFLGIAIVDRFSLTDSTDQADWLMSSALDVIDRSDAAISRVICRLGVAWALAGSEPAYAMQLVQEAVDEIPLVPGYLQRTLPGNVSRLLSTFDPALSARYMLDRIGDGPCPRSYLGLIPFAYVAELLVRTGHRLADQVLATLVASPVESHLSRLGLDARALAARQEWSRIDLDAMAVAVRATLAELASSSGRVAVESQPC